MSLEDFADLALEAGQLWAADQLLRAREHHWLLIRPMDRHRLSIGIDNPHDFDAAQKIFLRLLDNVFVLVEGRQHFNGEDWGALDETRFFRRPGHLFRRG